MTIVNNAGGAAAVNIQDGGNSITVDGSLAVTQSGAWSVAVNNAGGAAAVNIQDGGNSITVDGTVTANAGTGFPPVVTDGAAAGTTGIQVLGTDGTNAQILLTDNTGALVVTGSLTAVFTAEYAEDSPHTSGDTGVFVLAVRNDANADTTTTDGDYGAFSIDQAGRLSIRGQIGHDSPVTQPMFPVLTGGIAVTGLTGVGAVAGADMAREISDAVGRKISIPYAPTESVIIFNTGDFSSTANQALIAAGGAGVFNYLTQITLSNSSATKTAFNIKDATTTIYRVFVDAETTVVIEFPQPLRSSANAALNIATDAAVTNATASGTGYRALV